MPFKAGYDVTITTCAGGAASFHLGGCAKMHCRKRRHLGGDNVMFSFVLYILAGKADIGAERPLGRRLRKMTGVSKASEPVCVRKVCHRPWD